MERTPLRRASVAAEVRAELGYQNTSKATLAKATGISVDTLRRRLDGLYPFSIEELDKICHALDVKLPDFLVRVRAREEALNG